MHVYFDNVVYHFWSRIFSFLLVLFFSQALGESLFKLGKLLDFEKRVPVAKLVVKSLFAEREALKNKIAILAVKVKNDKKRVMTLEKSLQVEKDFLQAKG